MRRRDKSTGIVELKRTVNLEELSVSGFGEGGAFNTWSAGTRISGAVLGSRAGLSVSTVDSDGSNSSRTGSEDDGYRNTTANLSVAGSPAENLDLEFNGRYADIHKEFDSIDYLTGLPGETGDETDMSLGYFGAKGTLSLLDDRWTQSLRAGWTRSDADNSNEFGANGSTNADRYAFYYQSTWHFTPASASSTGASLTLSLDQLPKTLPAYSAVKLDGMGRVWVREYIELDGMGPMNADMGKGPRWRPDVPARWYVFSNDGEFLGTVRLPLGFVVHDIGKDHIVGVIRDADDVEYVVGYPFREKR